MCKLYHTFGSTGKILSTFLLVALSFDRFIGVCCPHRKQLRSKAFACRLIAALTIIALLLLTPMIWSAHSQVSRFYSISIVASRIHNTKNMSLAITCGTPL